MWRSSQRSLGGRSILGLDSLWLAGLLGLLQEMIHYPLTIIHCYVTAVPVPHSLSTHRRTVPPFHSSTVPSGQKSGTPANRRAVQPLPLFFSAIMHRMRAYLFGIRGHPATDPQTLVAPQWLHRAAIHRLTASHCRLPMAYPEPKERGSPFLSAFPVSDSLFRNRTHPQSSRPTAPPPQQPQRPQRPSIEPQPTSREITTDK